jgi:hypothetical protein
MFGQRAAHGLGFRLDPRSLGNLRLAHFQNFDDQLELRDPVVALLGAAPELHALQARDLELQLLYQRRVNQALALRDRHKSAKRRGART